MGDRHTQAPGQFFDLDLATATSFDSIVLNTTQNPFDYPRGYEVYVSSNGNDWGSPVTTGVGNGETTTIELDSVTSRYLRITQTGSSPNNWWSIHELNLYYSGEPTVTPPQNSALDRSAWQVSSSHNTGEAELAIDSSANTRWDSAQPQSPGQSFIVDMGAQNAISAIEMDTTGSSNDYPRGYAVYVSSDGNNWGTAIASGTGVGATTNVVFDTISARFVKIEQTGSHHHYWWSIHDLNIFGESNQTTEKLDSSDWSVSANRNSQNADNAIDNNSSTRWTTTQTQRDGQIFEVNLGQAEVFNRVVLDSAQSDDDQPRQFEIYVSNDGSNWGNAVTSGVGNSNGVTIIDFDSVNARYLQIVQTGSDSSHWWSIHELGLYAIQ